MRPIKLILLFPHCRMKKKFPPGAAGKLFLSFQGVCEILNKAVLHFGKLFDDQITLMNWIPTKLDTFSILSHTSSFLTLKYFVRFFMTYNLFSHFETFCSFFYNLSKTNSILSSFSVFHFTFVFFTFLFFVCLLFVCLIIPLCHSSKKMRANANE